MSKYKFILRSLQSKQNGGATASSGVEPKALIDNPGAAATKANSLIKPRPLKVGQDSPSPGEYCALCEQIKYNRLPGVILL